MITPVAIALVAHADCYLVGSRGPEGPLAGYHEFPGGKCRPGETPEACAMRECWEETELRVEVVRLRCQLKHTYCYGTVDLHFFDCRLLPESDPSAIPPEFSWIPRRKLPECRFPEPNTKLAADLCKSAAPSSNIEI